MKLLKYLYHIVIIFYNKYLKNYESMFENLIEHLNLGNNKLYLKENICDFEYALHLAIKKKIKSLCSSLETLLYFFHLVKKFLE